MGNALNIFLSYGYRPSTTGAYLERALSIDHKVTYIGPSYMDRTGYDSNQDVVTLSEVHGEPDLFLFVEPGINFFPRGLENLRCPSACYVIDTHSNLEIRINYARFFDYIFVAQKDHVIFFEKMGFKNVFWLPLACDPEIHLEKRLIRQFDVGFVGRIFGGVDERTELLSTIENKYKTNDIHANYTREQIADIYSASKIVVNVPVNGDINMRHFEAMSCGALLITKAIENGQNELFNHGESIIEYKTSHDLYEKIDFFLGNDAQREKIARAGQKLVLENHTYCLRTAYLVNMVMKMGHQNTAMVRSMTAIDIHILYARVFSMMNLVDPVLNEIKEAHKKKLHSYKLWLILAHAILRIINGIFSITLAARKAKSNIKFGQI